jgi:PleD family two-component response regulator
MPNVRVLMVTGVDDDKSIAAAKEHGADDYITKPLILEYLENTVLEKIKSLKPTKA